LNNLLVKLHVKLQVLNSHEEGQDLVEYALAVALVAFGAVAGMHALAKGLDTAFNTVSTTLSTSV
jgi:pilus assembly protein Flp/PilA